MTFTAGQKGKAMSITIKWEYLYSTLPKALPGMYIQLDSWNIPHKLVPAGDFDTKFFGTPLRYKTELPIIPTLPVKVEITGRVVHTLDYGGMKMRAKISIWNEDENNPNEYRGWLIWNREIDYERL